jgi:hypothetical protein
MLSVINTSNTTTPNPKLEKLERRIAKIKEALLNIGEMRPGSLSMQYNVCGSPNCKCKDPAHPKRHGPYYQLSYVHRGKSTSQFIRAPCLAATRAQIVSFRRFRKLTELWVELALQHAKLKIDLARKSA